MGRGRRSWRRWVRKARSFSLRRTNWPQLGPGAEAAGEGQGLAQEHGRRARSRGRSAAKVSSTLMAFRHPGRRTTGAAVDAGGRGRRQCRPSAPKASLHQRSSGAAANSPKVADAAGTQAAGRCTGPAPHMRSIGQRRQKAPPPSPVGTTTRPPGFVQGRSRSWRRTCCWPPRPQPTGRVRPAGRPGSGGPQLPAPGRRGRLAAADVEEGLVHGQALDCSA